MGLVLGLGNGLWVASLKFSGVEPRRVAGKAFVPGLVCLTSVDQPWPLGRFCWLVPFATAQVDASMQVSAKYAAYAPP